MKAKYVVCNENTLCYRVDGSEMLGVLAGSIIKGGRSGAAAEPFHPGSLDNLRPATLEDFDLFRVLATGYNLTDECT